MRRDGLLWLLLLLVVKWYSTKYQFQSAIHMSNIMGYGHCSFSLGKNLNWWSPRTPGVSSRISSIKDIGQAACDNSLNVCCELV